MSLIARQQKGTKAQGFCNVNRKKSKLLNQLRETFKIITLLMFNTQYFFFVVIIIKISV